MPRSTILPLFFFLFPLFHALSLSAAVNKKISPDELSPGENYALSKALGKSRQEFHVIEKGPLLQARNKAHDLAIEFSENGPAIHHQGHVFTLDLHAYGYADQAQVDVAPREKAVVLDNQVTWRRRMIDEWYVNGPYGLQQGFTLHEPPEKKPPHAAKLTVRMKIGGELRAETDGAGGLRLLWPSGAAVLNYGGLLVLDRNGQRV